MVVEHGFWRIEMNIKKRDGHKYYICSHKNNPSMLELVFVKGEKLTGKKELVDIIKKEVRGI